MTWLDNLKRFFIKFLAIDQKMHSESENDITESYKFEDYLLSEAYAIGNKDIIENVYKKLGHNKNSFWCASPNNFLCKRHSGIPRTILTALTNIISENYDGLHFDNEKDKEIWEEIEKDNKFNSIVVKMVKDALIFGEGAIKFTYDPTVSKFPIIEFVPAKKCNIVYKYNRLQEIVFINNVYVTKDGKEYILEEHYYKGGISYKLTNKDGKEFPLNKVDETKELKDIEFSNDFIAAVPFKIFDSNRYEGHGEGVFTSKYDICDAIDEVVTQYLNTVRLSSPKLFVNEACFRFDPETNERDIKSTMFNQLYSMGDNSDSESKESIKLIQSMLYSDEFGKTLSQLIVILCAGLISPSTINIQLTDTSLISNESGEAQREREKQTLYTVNKIKNSLQETLPYVVYTALKLYGYIMGSDIDVNISNISVLFDEYANPSFESQIQCIKQAVPEMMIMTPEEIVQMKYGNKITEEEKAKKVESLYIMKWGVKNIEEVYEKYKDKQEAPIEDNLTQGNNEFNIKEEILAE